MEVKPLKKWEKKNTPEILIHSDKLYSTLLERDAENNIMDNMKIETFNYINSSPVQEKFCQSFKISINSE